MIFRHLPLVLGALTLVSGAARAASFEKGLDCTEYSDADKGNRTSLSAGNAYTLIGLGKKIQHGPYIFVYGALLGELRSKGLFPSGPVASSPSELGDLYRRADYWEDSGHYRTAVQLKTGEKPLLYYVKPSGDKTQATVEVWSADGTRKLFERTLTNCKAN